MLEAIIAVLLFLILAGVVWVILIGQRRVAEANAQVERTKGTVKVASAQMDALEEVNDNLRDIVDELRQERRRDAKLYEDRAMHYEEIIMQKHDRIDELTKQNQNLAERVASLRQEGLTEGGEDFHIEDASEEPWSPDLQRFYEGLSPDGQAWAEQFIETRRDAGLEDEQILQELDEAGSVA